jgi:hypothetical protein
MRWRGTAAGAAALAAAFAAGCGDSEEFESQTLVYDSPTIEIEVGDNAPKDASRGDTRAFTSPLLEEGGGEEVGRLDGTVTVTDVTERDGEDVEYRTGTIQYTLDDGNIVAAGVYVAPVGEVVPATGGVARPIIGGTGAYVNARGQVTQTDLGDGAYRNELEIEIPSE